MTPTTAWSDPPAVLPLVAHPVRWRLLAELAASDRSVRELTDRVGERQSLVSYHLGLLRSDGIVRARRSSADGRDSYYSLDLARLGSSLQAAGGVLHPGFRFVAPPPSGLARGRGRRPRVLFLCTGNSARSQMAEALLVERSAGACAAESAGSNPKPLHPEAVRVMAERGIDIASNRTKHLDEFRSQRFDTVITLCDRVREVCPEFPSAAGRAHWSIPDPAAAGARGRTSRTAFERVAEELDTRIGYLVRLLLQPTPGRSTHADR